MDTQFAFLGASPDRLVFGTKRDNYGLLEVKCPLKYFKKPLMKACQDKNFCCVMVNGSIKLKPQHAYFYQVQGQMAITGMTWCNFIVWFGLDQFTFSASLLMQVW